jgi:SNF family Na+-dependent transporter
MKIFNHNPIIKFKGLAFTVLVINLFMAMFYNTVISWAVYYLFLSFRTVLPWRGCDNEWNTNCCFPINDRAKIIQVQNFSYDNNQYQKV